MKRKTKEILKKKKEMIFIKTWRRIMWLSLTSIDMKIEGLMMRSMMSLIPSKDEKLTDCLT